MERLSQVLLLLTCAALTNGQIILEPPVNTAAPSGSSVRLNCSAEFGTGEYLEWRHFLDSDIGQRIWLSDDAGQPGDPRFQMDVQGDNYDLIVLDVSMAEAGTYSCSLVVNDVKASAAIVVIDSLQCEPPIDDPPMPPDPPTETEGFVLVFSCSVLWDGNDEHKPELWWFDSNGMVETIHETIEEENKIIAMANVTATAERDEEEFQCRLFFSESTDSPRYTDMCISYYLVEHAAQQIQIYPNPDAVENEILQLYTGDHVNCSALGRPTPEYYWYEKEIGTQNEVGPILIITEEMADREQFPVTWVCRASNLVNGVDRIAEKDVQMMIEVRNPADGPSTSPEGWVIAVSTVIPLLVIITVVIVGAFFYMRKKKQNNADEKKPPNDYDNSSGPNRDAPDEPGPPSRAPVQTGPAVNPYPGGKPQSGVPVLPMTQQGYPGKVSPGYADLGVKHIGGSGASSLNTSQASLQVNRFMGDEKEPPHTQPPRQTPPPQQPTPPSYQGGPGYPNVGYEPEPSRQAAPQRYSPAIPQQYHPQYQPPAGNDTSV